MPKAFLNLLTPLQVEKIKISKNHKFFNDGGGLYLRAINYKTKLTKEWVFRYKSPVTGLRRLQTIGAYPTLSLKEAREIAGQNRQKLDKNIDPIEHAIQIKATEIENYKAEQRKNNNTVEAVFNDWKSTELKNREDKGSETERSFKKDVFPMIGNKPIHQVTRDDIKTILALPIRRGSNRMANVLLTDLKQFFRYADDDELIGADPTRKFNKARAGGKEKPRKRVLKEEELLLLKTKFAISNIEEQYKSAILLHLATGCRRIELISAELPAFNIEKRNFNIPSEKAKNTDEHNIYLSDFALIQVKKLMVLSNSDKWLFPNQKNTNHVSEGVISRNIRLRQPQQNEAGNSKWQKKHTDEFVLPGGHWILHDLRRTAATIMQQLGIMPHIIKKCLNQRTDDPIMEIYQRAALIEEQKQAFIKLGEYLSMIFD